MADNAQSDKIHFFEYHLPPLKDGSYRLTAKQDVKSKDISKPINLETLEFTQDVFIKGERYNLNPQEVLNVFPPDGASGDHANVLPHIMLARSTFPWEREGEKGKDKQPWLALLLFDADEAPKPRVIDRQTLWGDRNVSFPTTQLEEEPGETDDERITVIDVDTELLKEIMPGLKEIAYLTHVRRLVGENYKPPKEAKEKALTTDVIPGERAVVVANRFGRRGRTSIVHLVSLERRFSNQQFNYEADKYKLVRLVSLKSWRYHCLDEASYQLTETGIQHLKKLLTAKQIKPTIQNMLANQLKSLLLNQETIGKDTFWNKVKTVIPGNASFDPINYKEQILQAATYKKLSFKSLLMELDRDLLRLPVHTLEDGASANTDVEAYRTRSYVVLPHDLRNGKKTASFYHGPLVSGFNTKAPLIQPVGTADTLLQIHPKTGLLDVSYASAWELGRLLALQSKSFSTSLYQWKRQIAQSEQQEKAEQLLTHLPFTPLPETAGLPAMLCDWLYDLALLRGLPFDYLVPDSWMLPTESIRFFHVDQHWVSCLLDGAFSVGRVVRKDIHRDQRHYHAQTGPLGLARHAKTGNTPAPGMTGFLIRSDVVAGWPELQVTAYHELIQDLSVESATETHSPLRIERLSANVLICLFEGEAQTFDIHQKPESVHFGVSEPDDHNADFYKHLRNPGNGQELSKPVVVPMRQPTIKTAYPFHVVAVHELYSKIENSLRNENFLNKEVSLSSAGFGLQMIEGVNRVRFSRG